MFNCSKHVNRSLNILGKQKIWKLSSIQFTNYKVIRWQCNKLLILTETSIIRKCCAQFDKLLQKNDTFVHHCNLGSGQSACALTKTHTQTRLQTHISHFSFSFFIKKKEPLWQSVNQFIPPERPVHHFMCTRVKYTHEDISCVLSL